jgi:adenine-specific DNA-methyltransferase
LPAVLLLRKKNGHISNVIPKFTSIYSASNASPKIHCENVIAALEEEGAVKVKDDRSYVVQQGRLDYRDSSDSVWRIATETSDQWLLTVQANTHCTFGDIGKVRVGVKTTADKVFIRSDWHTLESAEQPELLKPLITHHIARRYKSLSPNKQILYTHQVRDGKRVVIDLQKFPRAERYLNKHSEVLKAREYVTQAGRKWFEIWVPQDPSSWAKPKLVFRDIAETPTFWIDLEGAVVNGDCYWITCEDTSNIDLLWLALAVGNSSFIEAFYDHCFNNKLYAGRRRFMTQYVEKFPLPDPGSPIGQKIIHNTKRLFDCIPSVEAEELEKELNQLVWLSFGLTLEESSR